MSYDLYLKPRTGTISDRKVLDRFRELPNYSIKGRQVLYENERTDVHFVFDLKSGDKADGYPFAFHINYFRPSFFILEVEPEIADFVRRFDCTALDPQTRGMGEGEYAGARLVSGWTHGNEMAYGAILGTRDVRRKVQTLPTDVLTRIWRWNYGVPVLQDQQTADRYVPSIFVVQFDGKLATMAVWPDAIPSILPKVDYLLVGREKFAPRGGEDEIYLPWNHALPIFERHGAPHPDDAVALTYRDQPKDVASFVSSLVPRDHAVSGVAISEILDRELVEQARRGR